MTRKGINLLDDFDVRLKMNDETTGKEQYGTLRIRKGMFPVLELEDILSVINGDIELIYSDKKEIKGKSGIDEYTLTCCDRTGHFIYPRYVIEGENNESIHGVEIYLTGFSSWFSKNIGFIIDDNEIKKDIPKEKFEEKVNIKGSDYWISSNYCCSVKKVEKRDFLVSEYTTIKVLKVNGSLTTLDVEEIAHEIMQLFSLLLGLPLSIEYAWLLVGDKASRLPFYFCCVGDKEEPFKYAHECLVQSGMLFSHGLWKDILQGYFSPLARKRFNEIWSRLPSLYSYGGAWEYKFLGYVSILDAYCNLHSEKSRNKLKSFDYQSIRDDLLMVIEKHKDNLGPDCGQIMKSFRVGIKGIKNTDLPTFKEKYIAMMSGADEDVKAMINFSEAEFTVIKRIRDCAAHGKPIKTRNEMNMSFEFRVIDKLLVLLMYFVYRDFGFSASDYARALKTTFSSYVRNAEINSFERDKLTGIVPMFLVDNNCFDEAINSKSSHVGIEYFESEGRYEFSERITREIHEGWMHKSNKIHRNMTEHIKNFLKNTSSTSVEYIGQVYLICGERNHELNSVCLVTYPQAGRSFCDA
jgi:hypothetical protein